MVDGGPVLCGDGVYLDCLVTASGVLECEGGAGGVLHLRTLLSRVPLVGDTLCGQGDVVRGYKGQ